MIFYKSIWTPNTKEIQFRLDFLKFFLYELTGIFLCYYGFYFSLNHSESPPICKYFEVFWVHGFKLNMGY